MHLMGLVVENYGASADDFGVGLRRNEGEDGSDSAIVEKICLCDG